MSKSILRFRRGHSQHERRGWLFRFCCRWGERQNLAKCPNLQQLAHCLPYAGQDRGLWYPPQFPQGVFRSLACARGDAVTLAKLRAVLLFNASILALCAPEIVFICCLECSDALQMPSAFSRVTSDSLSSLSRIVWLLIPHIILSRVKPSLRSLNSHVDTSFLSSVAYWSIVSPCSLFLDLVLNLCRSNVMFLRGLQ